MKDVIAVLLTSACLLLSGCKSHQVPAQDELIVLDGEFVSFYTLDADGSKKPMHNAHLDLGKVAVGDDKSQTIYIHNNTSGTIKCVEIRQSCMCTSATVDRNEMAPGESIEVSLKLRSIGTTEAKSSLLFFLSSRNHCQKRLSLCWQPSQYLEFKQRGYELGDVDDELGKKDVLSLTWFEDQAMEDFHVIASDPSVLHATFSADKNAIEVQVKPNNQEVNFGSIAVTDREGRQLAHTELWWRWKSSRCFRNKVLFIPNVAAGETARIELLPSENLHVDWGNVVLETSIVGEFRVETVTGSPYLSYEAPQTPSDAIAKGDIYFNLATGERVCLPFLAKIGELAN